MLLFRQHTTIMDAHFNFCLEKTVAFSELSDSLTQLAYRPSYDLVWDKLTSEIVTSMKEMENDQTNGQLSVAFPLWQLSTHLRDEVCVLRTAVNRTLAFVTDMKAHEEAHKRVKMEKLKAKAERQAMKRQVENKENVVPSTTTILTPLEEEQMLHRPELQTQAMTE